MEHPLLAGVMNDVVVYGFRTLFFLSAILLMVIVLLQEGKGGGLASALGGQGAETFGVSSGGVNRVTLVLAGLFLASALGHSLTFQQGVTRALREKHQGSGNSAPVEDDKEPLEDIEEENGKAPGGGTAPAGGAAPAKETPKAPEKAAETTPAKPPETPPVAPPPPPPAPAPTPAGGDKPK